MPRLLTALVLVACCGSARANGPVAMHVGGSPAKMSREACGRKAVAAMVAEKFPYAEVTDDGNARGWDGRSAVLVCAYPTPDPEQVMVFVLAASGDDAEAARLRNAVRTHVFEGKDDPATPKRVAPSGKVPPAPVSICLKTEEKSVTPLVKHMAAAATIVFEKAGMSAKIESPLLVFGGGPSLSAVFIAPSSSGVAVKFNCVTATAGDKPAEKLAEDVLGKVVKILYE